VLALVHGFTQTGRSWARVAELLGGEACTPDLPGHGDRSDRPSGLWAGARAIGLECGRGTYVGYSAGGRHLLHLALDRPDLVDRLVLLGATAGIEDDHERAARVASDEALARRVEDIGVERFLDEWLAQPMFAGVPDDGRTDRLRNTAAGLAASLRLAGTGAQEPLWDRLDDVTCPVLVLAGERDEKFTAIGRRLAAALPAATFDLVPGAGHAAHLEQPDAFVTLVRPWLG
jgi:2-succinyl-6-hydroxy-2,4-cyclohexadiene-1-carboxylate synthase